MCGSGRKERRDVLIYCCYGKPRDETQYVKKGLTLSYTLQSVFEESHGRTWNRAGTLGGQEVKDFME